MEAAAELPPDVAGRGGGGKAGEAKGERVLEQIFHLSMGTLHEHSRRPCTALHAMMMRHHSFGLCGEREPSLMHILPFSSHDVYTYIHARIETPLCANNSQKAYAPTNTQSTLGESNKDGLEGIDSRTTRARAFFVKAETSPNSLVP